MDKLNSELLSKIEQALDIKFFDWQVDYILEKPRVLDMRITGRRTGKTLVYIIKLLFSEDKPIRVYEISEMSNLSDWYCVTDRIGKKDSTYTQWFRRYLMDIYSKLTENGIQPRPVFFNKEEYRRYYSMYH